MSLKPADSFVWENCVATSLNLQTAAKYDFCFPKIPKYFHRRVLWDGSKHVEHAVLFEMETTVAFLSTKASPQQRQ